MILKVLKYKLSAVIVLIALVMTGCSTAKKVGSGSSGASKVETVSDMRVELRTMLNSYGDWSRVRVPVTLSLRQPKNISIGGTAIMERGKSVFISLKYFGMEIGNLYITDDSIMVVDKIHKSYASENVSRFLSGFDVNVSNLQDLLLGRVFVPGKKSVELSMFSSAGFEVDNQNSWLLLPTSPATGIEYGYKFSPVDILAALIVKSGDHQPVTCGYEPPVSTSFGPMSPQLTINYSTAKTALDVSFEWNLSKAKWNNDVELRTPSVNAKYSRISSADITKMISKF